MFTDPAISALGEALPFLLILAAIGLFGEWWARVDAADRVLDFAARVHDRVMRALTRHDRRGDDEWARIMRAVNTTDFDTDTDCERGAA